MKSPLAVMLRRPRRRFLILVAVPIAVGLLVWLAYSVANYPLIAVYHFESSDGGYEDIEVPAKGRTLDQVERYFQEYKAKVGNSNLKLYIKDNRDWTNLLLLTDNLRNRRWVYSHKGP